MKIAMIMDSAYPPDARVQNEIRQLRASGHSVDLFAIEYGLDSLGWFDSRLERDSHEGADIWRWNAGRFWYKVSALVYSIPLWNGWVRPRIQSFLEVSRPDVVHIHDMVIARAAISEAKRSGCPVVLDLHEDRPEILPHYPHMERTWTKWLVRPRRWARVQQELMELADRVILVTEEAREVARDRDGLPLERSIALPNVVWPGEFDPASVPETGQTELSESRDLDGPFRLLYIGDTSMRRGIGTLLQAVTQLTDEGREVKLIVVGDSSRQDQLVQMAHRLGISRQVEWTGWLSPDRLPGHVANADLGVSPLLLNPHHDTTYANKLFQYMAGGLPVLVSDCPAQANLVRHESCGRVHRAGDPDSLAEQIRWMMDHPEKRLEMGRLAREAVRQRWNWSVTGERLITLYESLRSRTNVE